LVKHQEWDLLAGVVRAPKGGVVSVVRREDDKVVGFNEGQELA
jgi:hypothetical protein